MSSQPIATQNQPITFSERAAIVTKYGIPVMPLLPRQKKAFLDNWQTFATTDAAQIADWEKKNPAYNSGAVARKKGFWFFEIDDPTLFERIEKETSHGLDKIDTLVVKSSGLKRHFYFKHDERSEAMGNVKASENGKEIFSARAHSEYVVSAGSIHPETGQPYEIITEPTFGEIPTAPEWLVNWILGFKSKSKSMQSAVLVESEIIPEGGRDNWLFTQACKMRDLRYSKDIALTLVSDLNRKCCKPPMDNDIVEQKVESAFTREPRGEVAVASEIHEIQTPDMPESVLVGRLGDIYNKHMRKEFPLGWSWLALVTVAGALVPTPEHIRTNLYSGLVGGVHAGKSQCIEWAIAVLGLSRMIGS